MDYKVALTLRAYALIIEIYFFRQRNHRRDDTPAVSSQSAIQLGEY